MAVAEEKEIVVTDVTSGEVQCRLGSGGLYGIRWSPDGRRIAAASVTHETRIWDAELGTDDLIRPLNDWFR